VLVSQAVVSFTLNVAFGAIAGGITNAVAVWMLFHPYERRFGLHGAIPKNKERLAKSIGKTVGERLLTPADIIDELARSGLRDTVDARHTEFITTLLDTERGSLRDLLPHPVYEEVERALGDVAPLVAERLTAFVESPEFETRVLEFVARMRSELASRPVGTVLTTARRTMLRERAADWADELAHSPELERGVREYLEEHAADLLGSSEPLIERIPAPVVQTLEHAIESYLPLAVERLGGFLSQPTAREHIRESLHGLFARFVEDLRFHERVIARLVVTERTFDRLIDSLETEGVDQLAALLDAPDVRVEISRTINDAVGEYLHKPLREMLGGPESERAAGMVATAGDYMIRILRADSTRGFLVEKLDQVLGRAEGRTWGDLLSAIDDETIAGWLVQAARSPHVRDWVEQSVSVALSRTLIHPIGRPGRWLPRDAAPRLAAVAAPALWSWLQTQLPVVVQRLDVQGMVERKVMSFSVQRVEEIIRGVTQKELDLIVFLGWVLGAFIGVISFVVSYVTRGV
jgi:uncharacterized membrane protein YheB (UPF0754 family)